MKRARYKPKNASRARNIDVVGPHEDKPIDQVASLTNVDFDELFDEVLQIWRIVMHTSTLDECTLVSTRKG
jgi:hypothetical protein